MAETGFRVALTLEGGYAFRADFEEEAVPALAVDEPPPLGLGRGPNAARLVGAAVGNCLAASLLFCLRRARIPVTGLRATVRGTLIRNEQGRSRIGEIQVKLAPDVASADRERMGACLEKFQDYCVVTESIREGIPVAVEVAGVPVLLDA